MCVRWYRYEFGCFSNHQQQHKPKHQRQWQQHQNALKNRKVYPKINVTTENQRGVIQMGKKPTFLCKLSWCFSVAATQRRPLATALCSAMLCSIGGASCVNVAFIYMRMCTAMYFCGVEMKKHFSVLQKGNNFHFG